MTSSLIDRPRRAADLPGNQPARAARSRFPVPLDRAALAVLLVGTAFLYLWGLGESGWANSFYSAAAQAGSESWKALFFGASDAAGSITVDKTPLALWPMALSVKLFGLSSWSILVPQALEGVGAVWLLHATVRRTTGSAAAGLLAGAVLALTPVAVLMFRFDNPDALLVLLLIGSAYATLRATEGVSTSSPTRMKWLAVGGALVGLAFLAKMLQAFLVLPALALTYVLFAASVPVARRLLHLLVAFGAMVLAGGWWVAIVSLWPASDRPYIGGSQDNSILELTLGYNGFGRLTGDETGSVGGGGGQSPNWGETGLLRMFGSEVGSQVAWLVPAAIILGAGALWFARRDRSTMAGLVLWLCWGAVTGLTFSLMAGIFHAYYTVALAPAIAACVAIGAHVLWQHRESYVAAGLMAAATAFTATWTFSLLGRTDWQPWLRYVVLVIGLAAAVAMFGVRHVPRHVGLAVAAAALIAGLAGPTAYSLATAATPHSGSIPSAGPSSAGSLGAVGGPGNVMRAPGGATTGGLLDGSTSSAALDALLEQDASSYTWVAAAVGSNSAAGYQLATEEPVMAIGGFNGSDPSPTLEQFQQYVADGDIHWFIASGGGFGAAGFGGPGAGGSTSAEIVTWVEQNFSARTVDGVTVYDLSGRVQ